MEKGDRHDAARKVHVGQQPGRLVSRQAGAAGIQTDRTQAGAARRIEMDRGIGAVALGDEFGVGGGDREREYPAAPQGCLWRPMKAITAPTVRPMTNETSWNTGPRWSGVGPGGR
ncbi:hypothetical protein GCM10009578_093390 [Streptomyces rhizosphaericus]